MELAHLRKPARHALEGDQAWGGEDGHLAELPAKALPQPVAPCNELGVSHNDGPDPAAVSRVGGYRGGEREGRGQQNEAAEAAVVGSRRKWRTHGAPRDLLRQKLTVSKCSPISAGLHPSLAQAFITLAPSRWVGIPLACAISLTLLM